MSELILSFASGNYDRLRGISDGSVKPTGIQLIHLTFSVEEIFWRLLNHQEFDVSEMSFSSYMIAKERGLLDYTAIPVFPSRTFRHSCIFINENSGIAQPSDLIGKKVGVPEYQMTAALWMRGLLEHDYGVKAENLSWYVGGLEQRGRKEKIQLHLPENISIQSIPPDKTLSQLLEEGQLDAVMSARAPSTFHKPNSPIKRLFPSYAEVEKEYFQRTGIFPIMHVVVIRNEILDKHPWVAQNLMTAFELSKQRIYHELADTGSLFTTLPWQIQAVE